MKTAIPFLVFVLLVALFAVGLKLDPKEVPSAYIDKTAPAYALPELFAMNSTVTESDLKGQVWLLNVWASWCGACRAEHSLLNHLVANYHIPIVGLNYKDKEWPAKQWLEELGNPYRMIAVDQQGLTGIDWGVYGVPETFVIDKTGVIRYKSIGPITQQEWAEHIYPLIQRLQQQKV
jgi:cytochrome c biogenesis protein CcmG/thiol:disulfide interchange protein DsbE